MVGAIVVGLAGWALSTRATSHATATIEPLSNLVADASEALEASQLIVTRSVEALDSIESATASSGQALASIGEVIGTTSEVIGGDVADGVESAVNALPAIIDTSRLIDRTMRALSLVGVDYDPDEPLDESLAGLEQSLRPLPEQLRAQVEALDAVRTDIDLIAVDADSLATTLEDARTDIVEAQAILDSASANVELATAGIDEVADDIDTYDLLAKVVVVAATFALVAAASAPLLIGLRFRRETSG